MRNKHSIRIRAEKGSSLAEAMVALGLVVTGLLGIVVLYTRSFALNREVVNQTIAAGLAAEGIEVVKNIIDTNVAEGGRWTVGNNTFEIEHDSAAYTPLVFGQTKSTRPLRFNESDGTYSYDSVGTLTPFKRTLTATSSGSGDKEYRVNALVEWEESGTTKSLEVEDHFFRWRP
ncbi:MAG: hypothetical protein Q8P88_02845 [Candidatus Jorgensenbacteria bacterium]|nr:hypothetical protein [Candidatus Jorgensenbacteria bacterium]